MNLQKYINSLGKIAVGISPALIILSTFSLSLAAQLSPNRQLPTTPNHNTLQKKGIEVAQIKFPSSSNRGQPARTSAGGRRGGACISSQDSLPFLTPLMPTSENNGKTVSEQPELYIYVPQTTTNSGEFVVIDEQGNEVYQTNFIPPKQPGIVKLTIPSTASLKTGKEYQWYFTIICNPEDRSQDEFISGLLERTTLGSLLNSYLQQASPFKQAEIYAKNKIWYDTISNVASLRAKDPEVWSQLLKSVGLEELEKKPFVDFGKPKP